MAKHDISHLETKIKELQEACRSLGDNSDLDELLKIIHRPGWTTPPEFAFATALVESLREQARNMLTLRKTLVSASREIQTDRTAAA
jgi:hypothetical protein